MGKLDTDMPPMEHRAAAARELLGLEHFMLIGARADGSKFSSMSYAPEELAEAIACLLVAEPALLPHFGAAMNAAIRYIKNK